jgi:hypothetical protein
MKLFWDVELYYYCSKKALVPTHPGMRDVGIITDVYRERCLHVCRGSSLADDHSMCVFVVVALKS